MARDADGYTLVELVVVILIFSVVMTLISVSFNRIASNSVQIVRGAETDIGGMIGLELMRSDLELAGFGLAWSLGGANYSEATSGVLVQGCPDGCPNADALRFIDVDAQTGQLLPPRAVVVGNGVGLNGSDYLVLKGTALGMSATSRSWSYLNYSSVGAAIKPSKSEVELLPGKGDRVIVLKSGANSGVATRELVTDGGGSNFTLEFDTKISDPFRPQSLSDSYLVYGVAPVDSGNAHAALLFPFNRADYYLSRPDHISATCAPGTGVLYKTTLNQNGSITRYPILDCVADLQVVLGLDTNGDGEVDAHLADLSGYSASDIRDQLQEVRVYILAQEGRKNPAYLFPVSDPNRAIVVGDATLDNSLGQVWTQAALTGAFGAAWRNYHW